MLYIFVILSYTDTFNLLEIRNDLCLFLVIYVIFHLYSDKLLKTSLVVCHKGRSYFFKGHIQISSSTGASVDLRRDIFSILSFYPLPPTATKDIVYMGLRSLLQVNLLEVGHFLHSKYSNM